MKIYHNIQIIDGKECIMLYVDYPAEYEFSSDFDSLKEKALNLTNKVRDYAVKNFKNLTSDTAMLILNGVALGTLVTAALINKVGIKDEKKDLEPQTEIVQVVDNTKEKEVNLEVNTPKIEEEKTEESEETNTEKSTSITSNTTTKSNTVQNKVISTSTSNTNTQKVSTQTTKPNTTQTSTNNITNTNTSNSDTNSNANIIPSTTVTSPTSNEKMVNLKLNSGQVISLSLEDYVTGVVCAEMPASFNTEALKAQAVAARTYALKRISYGTTLTATTSHQVYKTENELRYMWGSSYDSYYNKVKNAVYATKGEYLTYNGNYIDALYFSTSNGRTENAENVWSNAFPYLVSVESPWDVGIPSYSGTKTVSMATISEKLGVTLTSSSQIQILDRTEGNRVKTISICGKNYTGVEIRTMFGLKSADFDISTSGSNIVFTTRGYGHGVGMSQYGANLMAKSGYGYRDILKHYYTGVNIKS